MNNFFDPRGFENAIKQMNKENDQALRKIFDSKIKQNFLIDVMHKVKNEVGLDISKYYDLSLSVENMVTGNSAAVDFDICRMIVGIHRSNCIFIDDSKRTSMEKDENYKRQLVNEVINHIKIRYYASDYFRKKQIILGDEFLYFPILYKLFALCTKALLILNKESNGEVLSHFYVLIFNKALASLTLIEDNFLDNAYPICRVIIELYIKLLLIEVYPNLLEEHNKFSDYDMLKTCCGKDYPEEFENKFKNRKNQREKSRIDFLHYGWVDILEDYHEIVTKNPYSTNGLIWYLEEKNIYNMEYSTLKWLYRMCHSYTHGNVANSKYPLLHYFELSMILALTVPHTYNMLCEHTNEDANINGIDIIQSMNKDIEKLIEQHKKRSTDNFNSYYNYKK